MDEPEVVVVVVLVGAGEPDGACVLLEDDVAGAVAFEVVDVVATGPLAETEVVDVVGTGALAEPEVVDVLLFVPVFLVAAFFL